MKRKWRLPLGLIKDWRPRRRCLAHGITTSMQSLEFLLVLARVHHFQNPKCLFT